MFDFCRTGSERVDLYIDGLPFYSVDLLTHECIEEFSYLYELAEKVMEYRIKADSYLSNFNPFLSENAQEEFKNQYMGKGEANGK